MAGAPHRPRCCASVVSVRLPADVLASIEEAPAIEAPVGMIAIVPAPTRMVVVAVPAAAVPVRAGGGRRQGGRTERGDGGEREDGFSQHAVLLVVTDAHATSVQ